jgi:uncharacterized protein with HEPN domain
MRGNKNNDRQVIEKILYYAVDACDLCNEAGSFENYISRKSLTYSIPFALLQMGELIKYLSDSFIAESSNEIPWEDVRDIRHLCAHKYDDIDPEKIWDTVTCDTPKVKSFCESYLSSHPEE